MKAILLAAGMGKAGDPEVSGTVFAGRLPAADVHDDGRRRGRSQSFERVPGAA